MKSSYLKTRMAYAMTTALLMSMRAYDAVAQNDQVGNVDQDTFNQSIAGATGTIAGVFDTVAELMMVVGGVIGVIGAIRIYIKWNNGDQDVTKSIVVWGGAALFRVLSASVIKAVFNISQYAAGGGGN